MNVQLPRTEDIWKWITGAMLVIALAFLTPSIGWFIDSRDRVKQDEVDLIRERQVQVLIRLSAIDAQILTLQEQVTTLQQQVQEIQDELRQHELGQANDRR